MTYPTTEQPECVYCFAILTPEDAELVPALDDDEEWNRLAEYHAENCEWILTRAHRRDIQ